MVYIAINKGAFSELLAKKCEHKTIILENTTGKKLSGGGYEVDFLIRCNECKNELFRIGEYKREIVNLSKH